MTATTKTDIDPRLKGESRIVWLIPESQLPRYVRQSIHEFCSRRAGPLKWDHFRVLGYSELARDAKTRMRGFFTRRVFWVKDYDGSDGIYGDHSHPAEGVTPSTIKPGVLGRYIPPAKVEA